MLPRDRGTIVQVGSALAYRGIPLQAAYCGAKHAIQGFTESLRCELLHDGSRVRVTMVQLPAMNTPQFDWVKSRLPRRPQPVPPIYEPEVAARAIVWAASHNGRREMSVGTPTAVAIWGNKFAAGLADRYLARTGYDAQQTDEPADPAWPDNLWTPLPGDHGARGRFGARSANTSVQTWINERLPGARRRRGRARTGMGRTPMARGLGVSVAAGIVAGAIGSWAMSRFQGWWSRAVAGDVRRLLGPGATSP